MSNYIEVTDVFGSPIICSEYHWSNHVAAGSHSIMKNNKAAVIDTLQTPETVFESSGYSDRKVFFKKSPLSSYDSNRFYTKVVVSYDDASNGEIVTAFPIDSKRGGIGNVIYPE